MTWARRLILALGFLGAVTGAATPQTADDSSGLATDLLALERTLDLLDDPARVEALRQRLAATLPAPAAEAAPADDPAPTLANRVNRLAQRLADPAPLTDRMGAIWTDARDRVNGISAQLSDPAQRSGWAGLARSMGGGWLLVVAMLWLSWRLLDPARATLARRRQTATGWARLRPLALYAAAALLPVVLGAAVVPVWGALQPMTAAQTRLFILLSLPLLAGQLAASAATIAFTLLAAADRRADRLLTRRLLPQLAVIAGLLTFSVLLRTVTLRDLFGADLAAALSMLCDIAAAAMGWRAVTQQRGTLRALMQGHSSTPDADPPTIAERLASALADRWHIIAKALIVLVLLARLGLFGQGLQTGFFTRLMLALLYLALAVAATVAFERLHGWLLARLHVEDRPTLAGVLAMRLGRILRTGAQLAVMVWAVISAAAALTPGDLWLWLGTGTPAGIAGALVSVVIALFSLWFIWTLVDVVLDWSLTRMQQPAATGRNARLRTLLPLIRNAVFIALAILAVISVLSSLGVDVAPLLAGAGVVGLALGIGAQKLVTDVITGMFIIIEDSIAIGEVVEAAGKTGVVEGLTVRTLRLRDGDGALHSIPFSSVTTLRNASRGYGAYTVSVTVLRPGDVETALTEIAAIGAAVSADPAWKPQITGEFSLWGVDQVTPAGVVIKGVIRTLPNAQWGVGREINRRIAERLSAAGIPLSVPPGSPPMAE